MCFQTQVQSQEEISMAAWEVVHILQESNWDWGLNNVIVWTGHFTFYFKFQDSQGTDVADEMECLLEEPTQKQNYFCL